jgi:spore maturation protein CgeB
LFLWLLTVDVANSAFVNGLSVKLIDCFATGGFALTSRKNDLALAFGELADQIGYNNDDESATKMEFFSRTAVSVASRRATRMGEHSTA